MIAGSFRIGVWALVVLVLSITAGPARAASVPEAAARFASIDGGDLSLQDWRGRPVLVVNTASHCGFTDQYAGLQALQDRYGAANLIVLTVPSDSFNQELESAAEVAEFCEINYGLDLPMTDITPVRGARAHPFYAWLTREQGVVPRWNFTKVLLDAEGGYVSHWGSTTKPLAPRLTREIDAVLAR